MLAKENLQQTVRLILLNAFKMTDPELTAFFKDMKPLCPNFFSTLLPRSEQEALAIKAEQDEDESELFLQSDQTHIRPSTIGRIKPSYAEEKLGLPLRPAQMQPAFRQQLREAYKNDYQKPNIFEFGTSVLQWCRKLSFLDR